MVKADARLTVQDLGHGYQPDPTRVSPGMSHHVPDDRVNHGNTSIRNNTPDTLRWKGKPDRNGYGYFQRNRDFGQVFVVDGEHPKTLDALVLRTSLGSYGILPGAPGAEMYVQFFRVDVESDLGLVIDDNGTLPGQQAEHGFDRSLSRCDDYIRGATYTPIARIDGGYLPEDLPVTTKPGHPHRHGEPHELQAGHLRYLRFDFTGGDEITLQPGQRYAFLVGFVEPGPDRCLAIAITTQVHTRELPVYVTDPYGKIRWGIRREGNGPHEPRLIPGPNPPTNSELNQALIDEAIFADQHWNTQPPTARGFPDVDTYRTMQFYLEAQPEPTAASDLTTPSQ